MLKGMKKFINIYHSKGLQVIQIDTDNEFGCIEEEIIPTRSNMVAAGEHVRNIEKSNRTIKEGTRYHVHRYPYKRYPRVMVIGCILKTVNDLNQLPSFNGPKIKPKHIDNGRCVSRF